MKKLICLILIAVMALSAAACAPSEKPTESGATDDEANYPKAQNAGFAESKSETGLCFNLTLDQYTTAFNSIYLAIGGKENEFPYKKWKLLRSKKQDNGLTYSYYSLDSGEMVLTATVDADSLQIINLGCGVTAKRFNKSEDFRQKVMTVCGTMAAAAGGYTEDDVVFFENLFIDTIDAEDNSFFYESCLFVYSGQKEQNGETTMLFRVIPADSEVVKEWNVADYKSYWLG